MRKSDIQQVVMMFDGVMSCTVRSADDDDGIAVGKVMIWVVVRDGMLEDEQYDLRVTVGQRLERDRPMGVEFEIEEKPVGKMFQAKQTRTRFSAVMEEMTAFIAPLKKPAPTNVQPEPTVPRIFEQTVEVGPKGLLSPCPKCKCLAFEPNATKDRVICRGCPLPSPSWTLVYGDQPFTQRRYKCCSCGRDSWVTIDMNEVNLYCRGCGKLALHERLEQKVVPTGDVFSPKQRQQLIAWEDAIAGDAATAMSYAMSFATKSDKPLPVEWASAIANLQDKLTAEYGIADIEEMTKSPANQLVELFRMKLDLKPFATFAAEERNKNITQRQLKERDWIRRTGRTTRGVLFAIAEFMASDLAIFCVVGSSERYTKDLANLARDMHEQLKLARAMNVRALSPTDFDPQYDYKTARQAHVYIDHSYVEGAMASR